MVERCVGDVHFTAEIRDAIGSLRAALIRLYAAVEADPTRPQDVARRFRLDKSLTWKVSRALRMEDAVAAASVLPGSAGVQMLLRAMERGGAPSETVNAVREASLAYERVIEVHAGDREMLRQIIDSMGRGDKALERSRKQAFRGMSGVMGIQCGVRVATQFIAPARDDAARLDLGQVVGLVGVRRLRPMSRVPFFQLEHYHVNGGEDPNPVAPLGTGDSAEWVIRRFCSEAMPDVHVTPISTGLRFELGDGPVGRLGDFSCFMGQMRRCAVSRFASENETLGQLRTGLTLPAEWLLFDMLVHDDLPEAFEPELRHYCRLPAHVIESDPSQRLPIDVQPVALGRGAALATTLVPEYDELIEAAMNDAGWDPDAFHCVRVVYRYPPWQSTVELRYELR